MRNWIVVSGRNNCGAGVASGCCTECAITAVVTTGAVRTATNGAIATIGAGSGAIAHRSRQHSCRSANEQQIASGMSTISTAAPIAVILRFTVPNVNRARRRLCDACYVAA